MKNKISFLILLMICLFANTHASPALTEQVATHHSSLNDVSVLMIVIISILLFVIIGLGQVLLALAKMVREKQKKSVDATLLLLPFLLMITLSSHAETNASSDLSMAAKLGIDSVSFYAFSAILIIELIVIGFLTAAVKSMYQELLPQKKSTITRSNTLLKWWKELDSKLFTKAVAVEKEADVLLDHDYDGIRELDNALPPWWKYGFYVTIFVAIIYLLNFHVMGYGQNPLEEYQSEMEVARIEKENYEAQNKDKIDENNVPMADAIGIARGNEIFHSPSMCSSCHGQLGEGGAGPNLTDDYWIHKGSLNDIYQSIKHGYPDKGMQAWGNTFTPKEISFLASYIKSLRGTNPPGAQPPKGDLFIEATKDSGAVLLKDSSVKSKQEIK